MFSPTYTQSSWAVGMGPTCNRSGKITLLFFEMPTAGLQGSSVGLDAMILEIWYLALLSRTMTEF